MTAHPTAISTRVRALLAALSIVATGVLWLLLMLYGSMDGWLALAAGVGYSLFFCLAGYYYWYVFGFVRTAAARSAVAVIVQMLCLAVAFATAAAADSGDSFTHTIPLMGIYGLLWWALLAQWYAKRIADEERPASAEVEVEVEEAPAAATPPTQNTIDRISVKNGHEIEIIQLPQLLYIEAYGDYVLLYTDSGRFIKEQTMRWFEESLPEKFVRVHRSFIVNTDRIARVELAGKENYTIKLKNGVSIRASASGYKLLKQRLSL